MNTNRALVVSRDSLVSAQEGLKLTERITSSINMPEHHYIMD